MFNYCKTLTTNFNAFHLCISLYKNPLVHITFIKTGQTYNYSNFDL